MIKTKLNSNDELPLTCSRRGTCCHGKIVRLNPWELKCLAEVKNLTPGKFRELYCEYGGIILKFDGAAGWKNQPACSQYSGNSGCSVHGARPLSCRLYPLGRKIQSGTSGYFYNGSEFPCLDGCPEVSGLPHLTVDEYLRGQNADRFETAQDSYLELMQNIADVAFMLLLDTGLAGSDNRETLRLWRKAGSESPAELAEHIGSEWVDFLMIPEISTDTGNPVSFIKKHYDLLQKKAQDNFEDLQTDNQFHEASVLMMRLALFLSHGIGADTEGLADHWVNTAKSHGAVD
ncbi:MAG: YkgJ family cysteine cluster protein [Spirochaetes bacterium]|nr:YkgJ family cysteine cluster protein [Spirochaetota bacterium]